MFFKTDVVTCSKKLSKFLKGEDNNLTVDELLNFIKDGESFRNSLLPAISQAILSSLLHKTDSSSTGCRHDIMMKIQQQVLVIMKDSNNKVRDVSVLSPMEELVQQDEKEEEKTKVVVDRTQSLKLLTCSVHQAVLTMIIRKVGCTDTSCCFFRSYSRDKPSLINGFQQKPGLFSVHDFKSLAENEFWEHAINSVSMAKKSHNQITNTAAAAAAAAAVNRSPKEERKPFVNSRIEKYKLETVNWVWLQDKFDKTLSIFSNKDSRKALVVRCPFHKNGQEKNFSMRIEKVFEDDFNNIGKVENVRYMESIRRRLPYANAHLKTKLLSWITMPTQQEQVDCNKLMTELAVDEENLPNHKIVEFFIEEASKCGCVKWPERLLELTLTDYGNVYGNVYTSSIFSNLYCLSYGFQYTCRPCNQFNIPVSGEVATKIIKNNRDVRYAKRKK